MEIIVKCGTCKSEICNTEINKAGICAEQEARFRQFAKIKYILPIINSYVLEIDDSNYHDIMKVTGVLSVTECSEIKTQITSNAKGRAVYPTQAINNNTLDGNGITAAFLDTGIAPVNDFISPKNRIKKFLDLINGKSEPYDDNAHGTHVTGIAAGNGKNSGGRFQGVAPQINILSIKALDSSGKGKTVDVLAGLQWVFDNKEKYNIRIVNMSIGSEAKANEDPLTEAVEALWDSGIVVITAAGNNGPDSNSINSPGTSKKIITVGTSDDNRASNDINVKSSNYSGRGPTAQCIIKPDLVARGSNVVSCMSNSPMIAPKRRKELHLLNNHYTVMSGTSMSAPYVTGAVALLLQKHNDLTPDDVKFMLKKCCTDLGYPRNKQGWGVIDIEKLLNMEVIYVR